MNKILLIGHLGKDPEMSYTPSGTAVTKFSLAVRKRTTKSQTVENKPQDDTDWFNIVAWDKLAETCNSYLRKGSKIFAEGRLSMRKYTDRDNIQRTAIEVIINDMEMLTPKSAQQSGGSNDNFLGDDGGLGDLDDHPF
jgi:single-strand DNA-binding protein